MHACQKVLLFIHSQLDSMLLLGQGLVQKYTWHGRAKGKEVDVLVIRRCNIHLSAWRTDSGYYYKVFLLHYYMYIKTVSSNALAL